MTSPLLRLSRPALLNLATALEGGRIRLPVTGEALAGSVPPGLSDAVEGEINGLYSKGVNALALAYTLKMMAAERSAAQARTDKVDLVWTGREIPGAETRDTAVVVRELFTSARKNVLISSYALDRGNKARHIFQELANRMDAEPSLQVRMYLNVSRAYRDDRAESLLLREFAERFRGEIWPGERLPEVYHDPRAIALSSRFRACLHAKCVAVDDEKILVTSANFTEAAHKRNIEAGVLLADPMAARAVRIQFENLVAKRILRRVPGV